MRRPVRLWPIVLAIVMIALINLPLGHSTWTDHRLDTEGVHGVGVVTTTQAFGGKYFVTFRLPAGINAEEPAHTVEVKRGAYERAKQEQEIEVVYLPGNPSANRAVDGVPTGSLAIWLTVMANVTVLVMLGLMLWSRRHGMLTLHATEDLVRCKPDDTVLELGGGMFLVRGDILEIHDDYVMVLANNDKVKVVLGEHHNPVGYQQPVQVRGRKA